MRRRSGERETLAIEEKSPADFVSEVDRDAESAIAAVVRERHPDALLVGEELSPDALPQGGLASVPLAFVVDPLDGTTNFLHGYPEYAVSIAAVRAGVPIAGAVLNIPTGELFTATAGAGARLGGAPISVSATTSPGRALVGTGFPFKHREQIPRYLSQFERVLRATAGVRRGGSAALDLCDVACGRFDAFWELRLAPWDVAAGMLIVREAGGRVTGDDGSDAAVAHGPIVAGNPAMHAWLLTQL